MIWNWTWSTDISIIAIIGWIIPFVMLFFVPINRKPSSATAWLMLIFLLPYFGLIIFLLIGSPKLSRRRRAQQHTMDSLISKAIADAEQQPGLKTFLQPVIPPRYEPIITLNTNLGFLPVFGGNSVELLPDYHEVFRRIAKEIDAAKKFVHIEYFALSRDEETECVFAA
ncbi:MAG TPA: PLDc N-terminal domain-containing protein, partial [Ktedonobacteraceae bacterium]|nr:PLDc N-terminal domain-containing protein [Ktedonobacteraceae bacterium]